MKTSNKIQKSKINVLYIDDEKENLASFKATFRRFFTIHTANSAKKGEEILAKNDIEIVLTDQRMPEKTGVEFLESIIKKYPDPIRILVTGYSDIDAVIDAVNKGQIYKYIQKPWETEYMKKLINESYELYCLRKESKELTETLLRVNSQIEFMLRQKLSAL
ncbi:MAG: two-component system response regulator [Flavobacteriales bacterium CG18_big_fil_WC_8_21_14_2_50_32_9]|nr:MAG: two-component system response regulator [Flavobacteriales bacterium CG18_big_fil_WC_8_21_14_2_50_32_9]